MPELPEVETTRRGLAPLITGQKIEHVVVHEHRMRWAFDASWASRLNHQTVKSVQRRAKYLLIELSEDWLLVHLGMSGSLRCSHPGEHRRKHDHIELSLKSGLTLRFHDPRRFGCLLVLEGPPEEHPLLQKLGPEPLSDDFTAELLYARSRGKRSPVKAFIMDQHTVVGVGNIYASESLFLAGIHPNRPAGRVSLARYERLVQAIRATLTRAIDSGGSTLRDFLGGDGQPGYFQQTLLVYGRAGQTCTQCHQSLRERRIGQRSSVYCPNCQH